MDPYTLAGVRLFVGLLVAALIAVCLVLFLGVPVWLSLVLLAIADAAEIGWTYFAFKRMRSREA